MNFNIWGVITALVGMFLLVSGLTKSNFIIYRILMAKSKLFWKEEDKIHRFYQVAGILVVVFGILVALGVISK